MSNTPNDETPELFDPGCEITTRIFDKLAKKEKYTEAHGPALLAVETHKEHTKNHTPECFVNRPTH